MQVKLLGYRILARRLEPEEMKTSGGIVLPPTGNHFPIHGTVTGIGEGEGEERKVIPVPVKQGDRIMYWSDEISAVHLDGRQFDLLHLTKVIAVLEESPGE